ncbi:Transcription factor Adf-1 [Eumeta japonica]|uniref:Transcription factor Adf-1 n=1 Tax=Eumeta variegata TaxID=151549 RepID=A0A4C1Y656_EUMVA|nr:Transcription factor Adf-1 [Eumeta japonica]
MTDDLIELVRQRKVIYDSKCKDYKDHFMRNAAWEEIAEILEQPVNKCKDDWAKLRNAFASALKRRRNKKSGQAAAALVPWKYEESLSFLLPYMECRSTKTNVTTTPESPPTEESPDESLPESPSTSRSQSQSSSSRGKPNKEPKLQELTGNFSVEINQEFYLAAAARCFKIFNFAEAGNRGNCQGLKARLIEFELGGGAIVSATRRADAFGGDRRRRGFLSAPNP